MKILYFNSQSQTDYFDARGNLPQLLVSRTNTWSTALYDHYLTTKYNTISRKKRCKILQMQTSQGSQCELAQQQTTKYIYTKCMHNVNNYSSKQAN